MAAPPWRIVAHDVLPSTNEAARQLALAGDPGGVAVVAAAQTAGRGRRGRTWASPRGGLYISAVVRPSVPAEAAGLLPLAAGLALARAVEDEGLTPQLRWPNDVDIDGRKVGGVLCESQFRLDGRGLAWAVVGLGLNVDPPPEALAQVGGTSLAAAGGPTRDPRALVEPVLGHLAAAITLAEIAPTELLASWAKRAPMLGAGAAVVVTTARGPIQGIAAGLAPGGALRVATGTGVVEVTDPELIQLVRP
ncbi:MAG TPA: biotin--[acetyl-CoA-carboxylase] ligase [Candidatus Thermoplasmatota archaeon]|jgi:BirA family biotin operon repressor/biotin-[acetyl-CoA-carboxylase] ligase|nr:biotin--[acetyl-CoA-carboxylase] ligase [Candidatus Thermoplasmatota archaeon]